MLIRQSSNEWKGGRDGDMVICAYGSELYLTWRSTETYAVYADKKDLKGSIVKLAYTDMTALY